MKTSNFIISKIHKTDLAKCYGYTYLTFFRKIKALAKDKTNWFSINKDHCFTPKEVQFIVEELGWPNSSVEEIKKTTAIISN
jgi:hypothetical protein